MSRPALRTAARLAAAAVLSAAFAACGRGDAAASADGAGAADTAGQADTAAAVAAAASAAPAPADAGPAPVAAADVDRWERGMAAELEAVREADARRRAATSGADTLAALAAATESGTLAAGARAAGVSEERYRQIRSALAEVVEPMAPIEQEMDVSKMPAPMVAEMRRGREEALARATASLPADLVEAVRPRAAALRARQRALVGERFKAAGVGR